MTADPVSFADRHIGPDVGTTTTMLKSTGYTSLDELVAAAVPADIRDSCPLGLPAARDEHQVLAELRALAARNRPMTQMIGLGYADTITPAVIRRNMLESPAWYTAYTPYQPEISQGSLEALLTFQTMVEDLTALPVADASLLDEATAVTEAVLLMRRANWSAPDRAKVVVDADCFPQTLTVLRTRTEALNIPLEIVDLADGLPSGDLFGVVVQNPGASGMLRDVAPVAAAPPGSAGILPITWAYLALMGPDGLARATTTAVLAANYLAHRLGEHYPVLYTGPGGLVAHECILDLRDLTRATGVTAEDVAKRLMDYGFHAPTLAFPVAGTLMVEPTESENLAELDRFAEAMIAIRGEIDDVARGRWPVAQSPLRHAPHPADILLDSRWDRPYSREQAAYPVPELRHTKYWPPVARIDGAAGDRSLVCSCPPPESYTGDAR